MTTVELRALLAKAKDARPETIECRSRELSDLIIAAGNALPELLDRLEASERDAARYRHLRKHPAMLLHLSNLDFDAAIDAAMGGGT